MSAPLLATKSINLYGKLPRTPHIAQPARGKSGELQQLRDDMEYAFLMSEGKIAHPILQQMDKGELDTAGVNSPITASGHGFIQAGWAQARTTVSIGVANTGLEWIAIQPGKDGNDLYVEYVDGGVAPTVVSCINTNNNGTITAPNTIASASLAARSIHVGSKIVIAGSATNNGTYEITGAPTATSFTVSPAFVSSEGAGFVWTHYTNVITVTYNILGAVTAADVITALGVSATDAYLYVTARNVFGSTGLGVLDAEVAAVKLSGGAGSAMRCAKRTVGVVANSGLVWKARFPGVMGEQISVTYRTGLGATLLPVITVNGFNIDVYLRAAATTAADILRALETCYFARTLVEVTPVYGSTNAGLPGALGIRHLDDGEDGTAVRVSAGGLEGSVLSVSDTEIVMAFDALTAQAADEVTVVEIDVCGTQFQVQATTV